MESAVVEAVAAWRRVMDEISKYEPILKPLVEEELKLRRAVVAACFPDGQDKHEGTSNLEVWPGWVLKTVVKISRQVDEASLPAVKEQLQKMMVNADSLVRLKPEVVLKAYRELGDEMKKVFDQCLVIKLGSPQLELVQKPS